MKAKTHDHQYVQHPNPDWSTHACCTICGFATVKTALRFKGYVTSLKQEQLSPDLQRELGWGVQSIAKGPA